MVPVTIELIVASALIIAGAAEHDRAGFAITAATFAFVHRTRLSPLVAFACAALLGLGGFGDGCNESFRRCPALCYGYSKA